MASTRHSTTTLLEAVVASLGAATRYNDGDMVAPAAVLWTDADEQWRPVVEQMRKLMPELLTLGDHDPDNRTGPAIWLRCVIEPAVRKAKFPELQWADGRVPVIYMPGVSRQTLRAVEECPDDLKPLVELQYRGAVWTQKNGKDWTLRAFLVNEEEGLGLDVAEDKATLQSMQGSLSQLMVTPVERLRGRRLDGEAFDKLMIGDPHRELLSWLGDPKGTRKEWDEGKWAAFCNRCRQDYGFDPHGDGELVGGERLGARQGPWFAVWERFAESPGLHPGIPALLRRAKPKDLFVERDAWPDEAEAMEKSLRAALGEVGKAKATEGRERLGQLEIEHGIRRGWVWAQLDMCPLAQALGHLAALATRTATTLGGDSPEAMARQYVETGYLADDAAMRALASVKSAEDAKAVAGAVQAVYLPWLDDTAAHFQKCVGANPLPAATAREPVEVGAGECLVFADGLRFDVGQRLAGLATERKLQVAVAWRWAALPTVTATAKPAASPIAGKVRGGRLGADFCPEVGASGDPLLTPRFRQLLSDAGVQVIPAGDTGDPAEKNARGWTEAGEFDKQGHAQQGKLAGQIDHQLGLVLERIQALLAAGWKRVRVVTDHGWLLVPGKMPKVKLPKYLVESRWSRCASIKDGSRVDVPVAGWSWNPQERFAHAPGVHCFVAGQEYAHGGVSLQECVVPVLTVEAPGSQAAEVVVQVDEVQWAGLRCRLTIAPVAGGLTAHLRTKPNAADSGICKAKGVDAEGKASLLVDDESLEGTVVSVVIVDASGRVVCKQSTTVGGES